MSCFGCTVKFFLVLFFIQFIQLWYFKPPSSDDPPNVLHKD